MGKLTGKAVKRESADLLALWLKGSEQEGDTKCKQQSALDLTELGGKLQVALQEAPLSQVDSLYDSATPPR